MFVKSAEFIGSFPKLKLCPKPGKPEYAFIGRSNVGKSSLVNYLTGKKSLAKVSASPGKTYALNYFLINDSWYLVDLPGYGYARQSKSTREKWLKMIRDYLLKRETLSCVFQLIDSRIPPQDIDLEMTRFLGANSIPVALVFTKADKPNAPKTRSNIQSFLNELKKDWAELPVQFVTSSSKKAGGEQIMKFIRQVNGEIEAE